MMTRAFWPGRAVMITGGGAFLGQVEVRRLAESGADEVFVRSSREFDLRTQAMAPDTSSFLGGRIEGVITTDMLLGVKALQRGGYLGHALDANRRT